MDGNDAEHGQPADIFHRFDTVVHILAYYPFKITNEGGIGMAVVEVGSVAPEFVLPGTAGEVRLADFRGKQNVVLYFYPKDNTPG